jgi:hypothetical protein
MPKKHPHDNRVASRKVRPSQLRDSSHIASVGELLAKAVARGPRVTEGIDLKPISAELERRLPPELAAQLRGLGQRGGTLLVWVSAAVWTSRVRYAVLPLLSELKACWPELAAIAVRVRMPSRSAR